VASAYLPVVPSFIRGVEHDGRKIILDIRVLKTGLSGFVVLDAGRWSLRLITLKTRLYEICDRSRIRRP